MTDDFKEQIDYLTSEGINLDDLTKQRIKKRYIQLTKASIQQIDPKTNVAIARYKTITDAYFATGINMTTISKVLNGKRTSAGGYLWRYVV